MKRPIENWRPVVGQPDYEISDLGRVRSWKKYGAPAPRILKPSKYDGYEVATMSRAHRRIHRLVLDAFVGLRPDRMLTRHLDGDRSNNALTNLTYGTASENMRDRRTHGTDANVNRTECVNGHAFTPKNTLVLKRAKNSKGGRTYRGCRICRNRVKLKNYHRRMAALAAVDAANRADR